MWWPIGREWGRMGGVSEDHSISGWACWDCVTQHTERRGSEAGPGEKSKGGELNLRCQEDIWVDLPADSFTYGSGGEKREF